VEVRYDLEYGVWSHGANGLVELAIDIVPLAVATLLTRWVWFHRRELEPVREEAARAGQ
jgi:hypothetical protein